MLQPINDTGYFQVQMPLDYYLTSQWCWAGMRLTLTSHM